MYADYISNGTVHRKSRGINLSVKVKIKKQYHEIDTNKKKGTKKSFTLDVSFEIENELVVLFGPSGSGKTTVFKCISGITELDDGKVIVGNKVYFDKEKKINLPIQKRNIGYVFQSYTLFPHMNVRKNIECGLKGWETETKGKRVLEMLVFFILKSWKPDIQLNYQVGKNSELLWQGHWPLSLRYCSWMNLSLLLIKR
jgi:ABC-type Fe3+/spermidine/putrescine transport system ATPase subunit